jgi:predicted short-subunit dehydrogenase-like oxidoreductase (DUF2520 family)
MVALNVIGCGRVGKTLARLFARDRVFDVQDLLSGTPAGAQAAAAFIGAGRAAGAMGELRPAGVWMITPPDGRIEACARALAATGTVRAGDVAFHCSGALASAVLAPLRDRGAAVASVHPLKSFADPARAVESFVGTPCAAEGDAAALASLVPAFERIGAAVFAFDAARKTEYHAAGVLASNDLVALLEAALRCYAKAGFGRDDALRLMAPLVRETVDNVFRLGPAAALTGPVARGDAAVVARQREALADDPALAAIYRELGRVALDLARQQGGADATALAAVAKALDGKP